MCCYDCDRIVDILLFFYTCTALIHILPNALFTANYFMSINTNYENNDGSFALFNKQNLTFT